MMVLISIGCCCVRGFASYSLFPIPSENSAPRCRQMRNGFATVRRVKPVAGLEAIAGIIDAGYNNVVNKSSSAPAIARAAAQKSRRTNSPQFLDSSLGSPITDR
jgi:hypothetical protein